MFCILLGTRLPFPKPNVTWVVESDDATLCCAGRLDWSSGPIHSAAWPVGKREFCLQGFHSHLALQVTYMYHVLSYFITFYHRHPSFTHNLPMETTPERNTAWATLCGTAHLISIPAVVNLNENPKNNKKHYFWKKAAMTVGKVIFWCIRLDSLIFWCHGLPIWCPWWSPLVSFSSTRTCDLSIYRTVHHVVERVASVPINTTGDVWFHWPWLPNSFARLSAARCHSNSAPAWCEVQKCIVRLLYPENWDVLWDTFALRGERVKIPILIHSSGWRQGASDRAINSNGFGMGGTWNDGTKCIIVLFFALWLSPFSSCSSSWVLRSD